MILATSAPLHPFQSRSFGFTGGLVEAFLQLSLLVRLTAAAEGRVMEIISVIIAGIIIGLLGKFVAPGSRDNTPIWLSFPSSEPGRQGRVRLRARRRGRAESHEERSSGIAMRLGLTLVAALSVRLCEEQLDARRVVRHLHPVIRRGGGMQRSERSRRIAARDHGAPCA